MILHIITAFPESLTSYLASSILKRAQEKKRVTIRVHDLRDFTMDKHRTVDDTPYGGGAGMVLKVEPIYRAVQSIKRKMKNSRGEGKKTRIIVTAASGKSFDQRAAEKFSKLDQLILICGHYEGIDERVMKFADEKISIGSYVLTGGELPALVIADAVMRLIPGVLGNPASLEEESFAPMSMRGGEADEAISRRLPRRSHARAPRNDMMLEYPHYTRPEIFEPKEDVRWKVPTVLLSGDHKKIEEWRTKKAKPYA